MHDQEQDLREELETVIAIPPLPFPVGPGGFESP